MRLPEAPYAFRPAKRIQRMMFCDAVRALRAVRPMSDYQYVGLGHWQFVDFELMRREVGIRSMISIEKDTSNRARYEANKPFAEIDLHFGDAFDALQDIDLTRPSIVWLDYTAKVGSSVLRDLRYVAGQLPAGSVIATTVNCHPGREGRRLDALLDALGDDVVPGDVTEEDLGLTLPRVLRQILVQQVGAAVADRADTARLEQFMLLRYADQAPMLFWAAVIVDETTAGALSAASLNRLEQYRDGDDPLEVSVPWLSTREVIALNEQIKDGVTPTARGLNRHDCEAYARLHRWYPAVPLPL